MKKILTVFVIIAVMLTLMSCGNNTGQATDLQGGSQGTAGEESQNTGQETGRDAGEENTLAQEDGSAGSLISSREDMGAQQTETPEKTTDLRDDYEDNFDVDEKAAAEFGRMIKKAVAQKDVEMLAELTGYPVYVGLSGGIVVETREDLIALDVEELLSDEMVSSIADADENNLSPSMAGFTLYGSDGAPSITFGVREGRLAISGINYGY